MGTPWTPEDLDRIAAERPCRGSAAPAYYADIAPRMPGVRGAVLQWFRKALRDEHKKWAAAAFLRLTPESARPLVVDLIQAAISEPDPSLCRAFVLPLASQLAPPEAVAILLDIADRGGPVERGGAASAGYWLKIDLPGWTQPTLARLNSWKLQAFLLETDPYAQRALVAGLSFEPSHVEPAARALVPQVIAKARSHADDYVRSRIEIDLGTSRGPYQALTRP
jgi:hypothetical protein